MTPTPATSVTSATGVDGVSEDSPQQTDAHSAAASTGALSLTSATPRMNPELKAKWLEDLRSGKFPQARLRLRGALGYCCLGVLREIISPRSLAMADNAELLCADHLDRAGFSHPVQSALSKMNDEGKSFSEIADWIEANL
jgi:hypothetical protein